MNEKGYTIGAWFYKSIYRQGYEKALKDFSEKLSQKIMSEIDDCAETLDLLYEVADELAEQLKGGVRNDGE